MCCLVDQLFPGCVPICGPCLLLPRLLLAVPSQQHTAVADIAVASPVSVCQAAAAHWHSGRVAPPCPHPTPPHPTPSARRLHATRAVPDIVCAAAAAAGDTEYHDALEDLGSFSSRASGDDNSHLGSPNGSHTHRSGGAADEEPGGLLDRIALWWEGRRAATASTQQQHGSGAAASEDVTPTPRTGPTPRSPLSPQQVCVLSGSTSVAWTQVAHHARSLPSKQLHVFCAWPMFAAAATPWLRKRFLSLASQVHQALVLAPAALSSRGCPNAKHAKSPPLLFLPASLPAAGAAARRGHRAVAAGRPHRLHEHLHCCERGHGTQALPAAGQAAGGQLLSGASAALPRALCGAAAVLAVVLLRDERGAAAARRPGVPQGGWHVTSCREGGTMDWAAQGQVRDP